jgi:PIN domain nuclease of toxin-antitoxin system
MSADQTGTPQHEMTASVARGLDASAVLTLIQNEPGANTVREVIVGATVSSLNSSEIDQKSLNRNADIDAVPSRLERLQVSVTAFDQTTAVAAARLWLHDQRSDSRLQTAPASRSPSASAGSPTRQNERGPISMSASR